MTINTNFIEIITGIATELVKNQTVDEIKALAIQTGKVYSEAQLAAEIAVKLFLRISGMEIETRAISPVDQIVDQAEKEYHSMYAG